jgi:hypothetical protein
MVVIKTCGGKCGRIIPPMTVAKTHDAYDQGETPSWAWPVYAFVAWLAAMLDYVARFKRIRHTHRFKPNWRDSWQGLRQCEWLRDQLIAQGLRQLLNGDALQLDDTQINLTPPADYGGPCPRTPFDMNRRFLAIARWAADPEAIIRERFKRLATRLGIDPSNPLAAHASTDAAQRAAAQHELVSVGALKSGGSLALILSSARSARPSKDERVLPNARAPPSISIFRNQPTPNPKPPASGTASARPRARTSLPAPRSAARVPSRPRRTSRAL